MVPNERLGPFDLSFGGSNIAQICAGQNIGVFYWFEPIWCTKIEFTPTETSKILS